MAPRSRIGLKQDPAAARLPNPIFDVYGFRVGMGMTQAQLCEALRCGMRNLRRWERDAVSPRPKWIRRMRELQEERIRRKATS